MTRSDFPKNSHFPQKKLSVSRTIKSIWSILIFGNFINDGSLTSSTHYSRPNYDSGDNLQNIMCGKKNWMPQREILPKNTLNPRFRTSTGGNTVFPACMLCIWTLLIVCHNKKNHLSKTFEKSNFRQNEPVDRSGTNGRNTWTNFGGR